MPPSFQPKGVTNPDRDMREIDVRPQRSSLADKVIMAGLNPMVKSSGRQTMQPRNRPTVFDQLRTRVMEGFKPLA